MNGVTDTGTVDAAGHGIEPPAGESAGRSVGQSATTRSTDRDEGLVAGLAVAIVAGAAVALTARAGATALLVAVAVLQALLAPAWVLGIGVPGRWGGVILAGLAAGGADVAVSLRPGGRLGVLLPVLGLAVAAMFVHQLVRGAARVQLVSSLAAIAMLILAEVSLPALLQLRHEFADGTDSAVGGQVTAAAAVAVAGALVAGFLVDMVLPVPRFDAAVPRGILALVASTAIGAAIGQLMLGPRGEFDGGRAVFVGGALGALAGLVSVAVAFVLHATNAAPVGGAFAARLRPVLGGALPLFLLAPVAFLLCLAVRG